jgi:D-3-phosphoglycerate dehydrogenase
MYKVQTLNKIANIGIDILDKSVYEVATEIDSPDGIVLRSFSMHEMELPKSLKAVARAGAGVNNIPIDKCSEAGIVVFNTPGANANAVKEIVMTGLLISSRKIVQGIEWAKTLKGQEGVAKLVEKGKGEFVGPEIQGKTLGVVGLGAIGVLVANAANALGMNVIGFDPFLSVDAAWNLSSSVKKATSIEALLPQCDYVTIHVPFMPTTKYMFNKDLFSVMKKGSRLLNFARGELVDDVALKDAIADGTIECYVTDFPNEQTVDMQGVIAVPHLGASTPEAEDNCAVMAVAQLKDFLETGNIKNSVNFPNCELASVGKARVAVAHKNIPNMISTITNIFASKGINITDMISKSKSNLAYSIFSLDSTDESIEKSIKAIDGVLSVRVML